MNGEKSGRYLSFELGGESYALEVERVEVVLEPMPITRVPKAPAHLRGVINYRGTVIPVADLRSRFGGLAQGPAEGQAPAAAEGRAPAAAAASEAEPEGKGIVVLHIDYGGDDLTIGVLADAVREVVDIDPSRVDRAPRFGGRGQEGLISGIAEKDGRFIVILDVDAAFADAAKASGEAR